jgi:hypothetical protein
VKLNSAVRLLSFNIILPCCLLLASCAHHELPPIKDSKALHQDCAILYEQFSVIRLSTNNPDYDYQSSLGIRKIPSEKWPASIRELHPYLVCSYQGGIQMWIFSPPSFKDGGKYWNGYYVVVKPELPPPPQATTNHFAFQQTDKAGILLLKQLKF